METFEILYRGRRTNWTRVPVTRSLLHCTVNSPSSTKFFQEYLIVDLQGRYVRRLIGLFTTYGWLYYIVENEGYVESIYSTVRKYDNDCHGKTSFCGGLWRIALYQEFIWFYILGEIRVPEIGEVLFERIFIRYVRKLRTSIFFFKKN